jgi:hypothetical protein
MSGPLENSKNSSPGNRVRWPLGLEVPAPTQGRLSLGVVLVLLCAAAAILPIVTWQRVALAIVGVAGLVRLGLAYRQRARGSSIGEVVVDEKGVERRGRRGQAQLATFAEPFGVAVFADPRRTRAILAFTTPTSARYLTARLGEPDSWEVDRLILKQAAAVAESDALGAQLDDATLSALDAQTLVETIKLRVPEAVGRIYVSGTSGEPVVLDRASLRVGDQAFDLSMPLEWKAFMFHETVGSMAMLYHATWVRQEENEVVLVSPMPPEVSSLFSEGPEEVRAVVERSSEMQRAVAKDLRVMQASADTPPPVETRVAVERMFMFPLRRALDTAPRARVSVPPFRTSPRERNPAGPAR